MKPLFFLSLLLIAPLFLMAQTTSGYCVNKGPRGNVWLQKVSIGNWSFNTGGNSGYLYQPDSKLVLNADTSYSVQLELGGYPRVQDSAYWRIWIDFNRDMDFEDAGEQVFQSKTVYKGVAKGTLNIPRLFESEKYMMRLVVAKSKFSPACGESTVIEMEDYLVQINPASPCNAPKSDQILMEEISDNQAILSVKDLPALKYTWRIESEDGKFSKDIVQAEAKPIVLEGLNEKTKYKVRLKIECEAGESRWSNYVTFTTLVTSVCFPPNKNSISVIEHDSGSMQLTYHGSVDRIMEWRYRVKGDRDWSYTYGSAPYISFPISGAVIEVQARWFCNAQSIWTPWSESFTKQLWQCSFPAEKEYFLYVSFIELPDLHISINFLTAYQFSYRWYYREKGAQEWVDTIKTTRYSLNIVNLKSSTTYEIRVDLHCGEDSLSIFRTIETPAYCVSIDSKDVIVAEVYDSSAVVYIDTPGKRIFEYRFREKGDSAFTTVRPNNWHIKGLTPNTTYEVSMRVVCEKDSIPDWSPWVVFKTKVCDVPRLGDLGVVQSYLPDSIHYRADFINFTGSENLQFYWKYKAKNEKNWQQLNVQDENDVVFKNLKKGVKYEVQLLVRCPSQSTDSLSLTTSFTAIKDDCLQKPDTAAIILKLVKGLHPNLKFKSPRGYDYQMRTKPADRAYFGYYYSTFSDGYSVTFAIFPGVVNDFQYRYVCPNGNISPWSDVVKLDNTNNFKETELPQLATGIEKQELQNQAKMQVRLTPNPSSGQFSILFPEAMEPQPEAYLEVLNTAGQRIYSLKTAIDPAQTLPLDLRQQAPGLYILRIQVGQKVYTERIMIASNH